MLGISTRFGLCVRDVTGANGDNLELFADQILQIQRTTDFPIGSAECVATKV